MNINYHQHRRGNGVRWKAEDWTRHIDLWRGPLLVPLLEKWISVGVVVVAHQSDKPWQAGV